ncbi:MAG: 3-deoxy-D-manno-octulosonic acid transferase [Bacteroidales bacterium]|nr:3-deoxy-D-manno-octulosonic acid transferase [Bacteroidales bacterium]MCF8332582.1 3-deoxy-D-manno-octulosonic acid transferase [Bacteroidales bacterium]
MLYNAGIYVYNALIRIAALSGNKKAKQWIGGRKKIFSTIRPLTKKTKTAWFHCASLGEFEQGRPVIEAFRQEHPNHKIVLTFFSPSGYTIRKNYNHADYVYYLPSDTLGNARRFTEMIKPDIAFFIKYEFWFNYLNELKKSNIPTYLVSGIFRKNQHFFKWYGTWFRKQLKTFDKFFVQDKPSHKLIESLFPGKSIITGDTRFDRVAAIARQARAFPDIARFKNRHTVLLAGSSWPEDEEVFLPYVLDAVKTQGIKLIIAPHEVHEQRINRLIKKMPSEAIRYSQADMDFSDKKILVIDSIGLLSHLYQYGDMAYIGGGFGEGIHNTLEAAAFGLPVMFGPNYHKFREAKELIQHQAAFPVKNSDEFSQLFSNIFLSVNSREKAGKKASRYVHLKKGGTRLILEHISHRI